MGSFSGFNLRPRSSRAAKMDGPSVGVIGIPTIGGFTEL
jgi:hypothetical protein